MIKAFNFVVNDKKGFNNDSFRFQDTHAGHVSPSRQPSVNQQAVHKCLVVRPCANGAIRDPNR